MRPDQIEAKAKEFDISVKTAIKIRIRYLIEICGQWDDYISGQSSGIPAVNLQAAFEEIDRLKRYEQRIDQGKSVKQDITDEMVQRAREYPIDRLIDFKRGVAPAFCHPDKNPSLSWDRKRNRARCFVCDKGFDAIAVLMQRDNYTFIEAVKRLAEA